MTDHDPYTTIDDSDRAFWGDAVADTIEARDPDEPVVIKGGVSPSGVPHIGHLNEIVRGYVVAEVLRDRGHEVRQVFTADDKDRLRKIPRQLADLEWNVVGLGEVDAGALGRNLGKPYTSIPDPFGCCDSYGAHFTNLLARSAEILGIPIEVVSNTELYADGALEEATRHVLTNRNQAREVLADYQDSVDADYVPFQAECQSCGILTDGIVDVDPGDGTVVYECRDVTVGDETIEGCGHEGEVSLREGKLPWRFEWPAQWDVLGVDFEPFGKDHAEGSWPSGVAIAEDVFDIDPPVPMVYEWFTLNGEALSSSSGNVITVEEVLELIEPEVLRYFFLKDPTTARDFSIEHLDQLVDEFDRFERVFFGEQVVDTDREAELTERDKPTIDRAYPYAVAETTTDDKRTYKFQRRSVEVSAKNVTLSSAFESNSGTVRETTHIESDVQEYHHDETLLGDYLEVGAVSNIFERADDGFGGSLQYEIDREAVAELRERFLRNVFDRRLRIPYTFAAVLGMTDDPDLREEIARREGHIPEDAPEWTVEAALARVEGARAWARRTDNAFNYDLKRGELPDVDFDADTRAALDDLADFVAEGRDGEAIQGRIYELAEEYDLEVSDFFAAGYRLLFALEEGPKLGPFLAKLDREFVVDRLRRER